MVLRTLGACVALALSTFAHVPDVSSLKFHGRSNGWRTQQSAADLATKAASLRSGVGSAVTQRDMWPNPVYSDLDDGTCFAVPTAEFGIVASGYSDAALDDAITRYGSITFPYGPGGHTPAFPNILTTLYVNVTTSNTFLGIGMDETYWLTVGVDDASVKAVTATLTANTIFGAMRGLETFAQLMGFNQSDNSYFTCYAFIYDYPRFRYRGVMLDTSRNFIDISAIQAVMDTMAAVKLNALHLHFTDDQSWPIEFQSYPLLTVFGAYSNYSHSYTTQDLVNLGVYARARGIVLIPELDSPAHISALGLGYPEFLALNVVNGTNQTFRCEIDPTNPDVVGPGGFWDNVIGELAALWPDSPYHGGGDEFYYNCWWDAPNVMAWMNANNFSILDAYWWYERNLINITRSHNRKLTMFWEDINGFPAGFNGNYNAYQDVSLTVWSGGANMAEWQYWLGEYTSQNASCVLAGPFYILEPADPEHTWQDFYEVDLWNLSTPITELQKQHILGGEVCVWGDATQADSADVVLTVTPHMFAVGESWWSPQNMTSGVVPDEGRLHDQRCRLVARGYPSHKVIPFGEACPVEYQFPLPAYDFATRR